MVFTIADKRYHTSIIYDNVRLDSRLDVCLGDYTRAIHSLDRAQIMLPSQPHGTSIPGRHGRIQRHDNLLRALN
jgi:hypothetical protein